jgi:hypothetical protein
MSDIRVRGTERRSGLGSALLQICGRRKGLPGALLDPGTDMILVDKTCHSEAFRKWGEMKKVQALGQTMRKATFAVVLGAPFVLSGCGGPGTPDAAPSTAVSPASSSATATPSPSTLTVSEKATCTLLVGPDEDGPLIQYVNGITNIDPSDQAAVAKLIATRDEVKAIAKSANQEMKELLTALFSEDVNDFKAAGTDLLTRCG